MNQALDAAKRVESPIDVAGGAASGRVRSCTARHGERKNPPPAAK